MTMPDLKDSQDKWKVEEVRDKRQIKNMIHYLIKWIGWPSEYNLYEPATHLTNAPEAVAAYKQRLKHKRGTQDAAPAK